MPTLSAPVAVTTPKKPPRIIMKQLTERASDQPRTGAVRRPERVAPVIPSTPAAAMMTVMIAKTTKMAIKMVRADSEALFFLAFSIFPLFLENHFPQAVAKNPPFETQKPAEGRAVSKSGKSSVSCGFFLSSKYQIGAEMQGSDTIPLTCFCINIKKTRAKQPGFSFFSTLVV